MTIQRGSVKKRPGRNTWRARWYEDGQAKSKSFTSAADARAHLNNVLAKLQRGEMVTWPGDKVTLDEWFGDWMQRPARGSTRPLRPTTAARDRQVYDTNFKEDLGGKVLTKVTSTHVQAAVTHMSARLAPTTVRTNYGVLRACLAAAATADLIARTPCRGIRLPAQHRPDDEAVRILEPAELDALAAAMPAEYRSLVYVAGVLGLRWSECVGLRVGRVDFLKRTMTVAETIGEVGGVVQPAPVKTPSSRRTLRVPPFLVSVAMRKSPLVAS